MTSRQIEHIYQESGDSQGFEDTEGSFESKKNNLKEQFENIGLLFREKTRQSIDRILTSIRRTDAEALSEKAAAVTARMLATYKRFLRITIGASLLAGTLSVDLKESEDYAFAQQALHDHPYKTFKVTERQKEAGNIEFVHEDEKTTQVMNYFTGRGDLPENLKIQVLREDLAARYFTDPDSREKIPGNLEDLDVHSLERVYLSFFTAEHNMTKNKSVYLDTLYQRRSFDSEVERYLWKILKEVGGPKIELFVNDINYQSFMNQNVKDFSPVKGASQYLSMSNTMYIEYAEDDSEIAVYDLLAEMSHAKRMHDDPIQETIDGRRDQVLVRAWSLQQGIPYEKARSKLYDTPGTTEEVAHHHVYPVLRKGYRNVRKLDD